MKRLTSLILALVMCMSLAVSASAAETTQVTYTADDGTGAQWTLTVPALLEPGESDKVILEGTWPANMTLTVTADEDVTLTNNLDSGTKTLDVNFAGITQAGSNTERLTATEDISVENIENALFGTWSGQFYYNVSSETEKEPTGYTINAMEDVIDENGVAQLSSGDTLQLEAVATYGTETASWASNDEDIISIDKNGLATAKKPGTTTITYTMGDLSDDLTVTVDYADFAITQDNRSFIGYTDETTELVIPETVQDGDVYYKVTSIADGRGARTTGSFYNCINLTSVIIPDSVTSIGSSAFSGCPNIATITVPASVVRIGVGAFSDCTSLDTISVDSENEKFYSVDGVLYTKTTNRLGAYPAGKIETTFIIPNGVTAIVNSAFSGCTSLTSVIIPDSVTSIDTYAFSGCTGLTSITIPDGVTSIGSNAFSCCDGLTSVTIGDSVTSIGYNAFSHCTNLVSVTIGDSVISIGQNAFYGCENLTSVTIPDSVTSISSQAFYGCKNLANIYYTGTEDQWNTITKGTHWDYNVGSATDAGTYTITYNYAG